MLQQGRVLLPRLQVLGLCLQVSAASRVRACAHPPRSSYTVRQWLPAVHTIRHITQHIQHFCGDSKLRQ
jgi:hypothetical protein